MASVPIIQDSQRLEVSTGRQRVQASPDAFGASEARGAASIGEALGHVAQVAADKEDEFAEAQAIEIDNELSRRIRERFYNTENGYLSTQRGRNAIDGRGQVEADIDGYAAELVGGIQNERARRLAEDVARRRVTGALGDVATYAADQSRVYHTEQLQVGLENDRDNAIAAWGDDAQVAANIATAIGRIHRIAELQGWDESIRDQRIRDFQSDVISRQVVQLAATDPAAAQELVDRSSGIFTAQDRAELLGVVRAAQSRAVEEIEGMAWQAFANGRPLQSIGQEAYGRLTTDPLFGVAHTRLREAYRTRAQAYGAGGRARDNSPAYIAAILAADRDPSGFSSPGALESFIAENAGDLSGGDMVRLLNRRREMGSDQSVNAQTSTFNAIRSVAANALGAYGLNLSSSGRLSERERRTADAFDSALQRETQRWLAENNGRPPQGEEAQLVIGRAIVGMNDESLRNLPNFRVRGDRGRTRRADVQTPTAGVMPFDQIPLSYKRELVPALRQRLGRQPTRGEVENAYAAYLSGVPFAEVLRGIE